MVRFALGSLLTWLKECPDLAVHRVKDAAQLASQR